MACTPCGGVILIFLQSILLSVVNLLVRDRAEAFIRTKPFKVKHIHVNEGCDILVEGWLFAPKDPNLEYYFHR
ncbi:hypothetical protein CCACVL1_11572 [Corchorus capsularis]|uniref:Uncharacterized protein n=1 Tax=Corchorus capsularis TaxID=210143 RepID=A0A1R3IKG5_COCAP|nr:hypothetical protein CCACVL1_11572 [Corchorus capsularis]